MEALIEVYELGIPRGKSVRAATDWSDTLGDIPYMELDRTPVFLNWIVFLRRVHHCGLSAKPIGATAVLYRNQICTKSSNILKEPMIDLSNTIQYPFKGELPTVVISPKLKSSISSNPTSSSATPPPFFPLGLNPGLMPIRGLLLNTLA